MRKSDISFSKNGSVTVEAALVFPIFFYAIMVLCTFFVYMETCAAVRDSMLETARQLSSYGDVIHFLEQKTNIAGTDLFSGSSSFQVSDDNSEQDGINELTSSIPFSDLCENILEGAADSFTVRLLLERELQKRVNFTAIQNGSAGINCLGSDLINGEDEMRICCNFTLKTPVTMFRLRGIPVKRSLTYRYFSGYRTASLLEENEQTDESDADRKVYITESGKVYHFSLSCPNLKIVIREVNAENVGSQRNEAGGKYYPCEKCAKGKKPESLFITADGDRYHYEITCSGLKRSISEVAVSEVGNKRPCKRCKDKEQP